MVSSASLTAITSFLLGSIGMVIFTRSKEIKSRNRISNVFWIFLGLGFATLIFNEGSYLTERAGMYIQLLQNGFSGTSLDASLSTTAYLLWMLDDPGNLLFGVGFGNGAFYAYDYIATLSGFAERGFTSSRVPIIDLISSIGFFGALLLYLLWFKWLSYIFNFSRKLSLINFRELTFIRGGIAYYLFAGLIYSTNIQIWLLFGLAFTIISNYKRAKKIGQF